MNPPPFRVMKLGEGGVIKESGAGSAVLTEMKKIGKGRGFAHFLRSSDTTATSRVMITTIRMT